MAGSEDGLDERWGVPLQRAEPLAPDEAVRALAGSDSGLVIGWVGVGLSGALRGVARRRQQAGDLVASARLNDDHSELPLSYLRSLGSPTQSNGAASSPALEAVRAVEDLAGALLTTASGRRMTLLLDDLHRADRHSLAALPLLTRRLDAVVVAAAHTTHPDGGLDTVVECAVGRLELQRHIWLRPGARAVTRSTYPNLEPEGVPEQILRLVERGLTNRSIANRLNLSEKAIEGQLTRLLAAYGCVNRTQLAARHLGGGGSAEPA